MSFRLIIIILYFFLYYNVLGAQQTNQNNYFELNGFLIPKQSNGYMYISYTNNNNVKIIDSTKIVNNKFTLKGYISSPRISYISNNNKFRLDGTNTSIIYLEPKRLIISLDFFDFKTLKLDKSKTQEDYIKLIEIKKNIPLKLDSIYKLRGNYNNEITTLTDSVKKNILLKKIANIEDLALKISADEMELEDNFIKQNTSSYVTLDLLLSRLRKRDALQHLKYIKSLFSSLSKEVKNSQIGLQLSNNLKNIIQSDIGSQAPNFIAKDVKNLPLDLRSFNKDKYILIDFWASWCAPCRDDFPFMKKIYSEYNKKGFEIICISKDENLEVWRSTILKENLEMWKHFSIKENDSQVEDSYAITAIPVKILINKDGLIIGRWRGGGEENKLEIETLLNKVFTN
jgi:thiol-disulfide isomerase/thioredoxin